MTPQDRAPNIMLGLGFAIGSVFSWVVVETAGEYSAPLQTASLVTGLGGLWLYILVNEYPTRI